MNKRRLTRLAVIMHVALGSLHPIFVRDASAYDCCVPYAYVAVTGPYYLQLTDFECCCDDWKRPPPSGCPEPPAYTGDPICNPLARTPGIDWSGGYYTIIYACGECDGTDPLVNGVPCGGSLPGGYWRWDGTFPLANSNYQAAIFDCQAYGLANCLHDGGCTTVLPSPSVVNDGTYTNYGTCICQGEPPNRCDWYQPPSPPT